MHNCPYCNAPCEWSENTNSRGKKFRIDLNTGAPHMCPKLFGKSKVGFMPIVNTTNTVNTGVKPGFQCKFKCGTKVTRDESLPREPKLREVYSGYQHDYLRCGEILTKQGKQVPFHYNKIDKQMIVEQDRDNRINADNFDPNIHFYPSDIFILVGFDEKGQALKERNDKYHNADGEYKRPPTIWVNKNTTITPQQAPTPEETKRIFDKMHVV